MAAVVLDPARFGVRLAVGPCPRCHAVALVQFVQEHVAPLRLGDVVVDPDLAGRHELVDVVVAAGGEVDVEDAADQPPVDDPHADAVFQLLPQPLVDVLAVGQFLSAAGQLPHVAGPPALLALLAVGGLDGLVVGHALGHQAMLDQQVVDEEPPLVVLGLAVDPELVGGNVGVAVVLPEVGELLVDVAANVAAVDDPHLQIAPLVVFCEVRRLECFGHEHRAGDANCSSAGVACDRHAGQRACRRLFVELDRS